MFAKSVFSSVTASRGALRLHAHLLPSPLHLQQQQQQARSSLPPPLLLYQRQQPVRTYVEPLYERKSRRSHRGRIATSIFSIIPQSKASPSYTPVHYEPQDADIKTDSYALIAREAGLVRQKALEVAEKNIKRYLKTVGGELVTLALPFHPMTAKASGVRMGKGKGNIDHYVARVRKNMPIFEIRPATSGKITSQLDAKTIKEAFHCGQPMLGIPTIIFPNWHPAWKRWLRAKVLRRRLAIFEDQERVRTGEDLENLQDKRLLERAVADYERRASWTRAEQELKQQQQHQYRAASKQGKGIVAASSSSSSSLSSEVAVSSSS